MRSAKKTTTPRLSVIVPVYNEALRIDNIRKLFVFLKKKPYFKECIVVNDGSTDNTLSALKLISETIPIHIITYAANRGKGYAIKRGVEAASGTHTVFIDVDLSTDPRAFDDAVKIMKRNAVVIGTRKNKRATLIRRQNPIRELMGKTFTALSAFVLGISVSDFTCGFKVYETKTAKLIAAKQTVFRWAYDNEYLFLAKKFGVKIIELPVVWADDKNTKVRFPQDIITSLRDLMIVRIMNALGRYQ